VFRHEAKRQKRVRTFFFPRTYVYCTSATRSASDGQHLLTRWSKARAINEFNPRSKCRPVILPFPCFLPLCFDPLASYEPAGGVHSPPGLFRRGRGRRCRPLTGSWSRTTKSPACYVAVTGKMESPMSSQIDPHCPCSIRGFQQSA
jgi:hypothetical protein